MKAKKPLVKNEEPKTHEKAALNKSQLYQWIVTSVLTVIVAAVTVSMTLYQIKLSQIQTDINQVFSPIRYEVFDSDKSFQYNFSGMEIQKGYPCIRFTNGRPKDVAVIIYNSHNNKMIVTSSAVQTTGEIIIKDIKTEMPRDDYDADAPFAYDYFFLYFTDSNSTKYLNMIYYQIDLKQGTVSDCIIASEADLLLLKSNSLDQYKREMLEDYKKVMVQLGEIHSLL